MPRLAGGVIFSQMHKTLSKKKISGTPRYPEEPRGTLRKSPSYLLAEPNPNPNPNKAQFLVFPDYVSMLLVFITFVAENTAQLPGTPAVCPIYV